VNRIDSCLFLQSKISFLMCPPPDGVARPPRRGLAGQGCFFKNDAHKNCTRTAAGASVCEVATFILFGGIGASAPIFVILSIHALPNKKQRCA
jgi:hypothetical protein